MNHDAHLDAQIAAHTEFSDEEIAEMNAYYDEHGDEMPDHQDASPEALARAAEALLVFLATA